MSREENLFPLRNETMSHTWNRKNSNNKKQQQAAANNQTIKPSNKQQIIQHQYNDKQAHHFIISHHVFQDTPSSARTAAPSASKRPGIHSGPKTTSWYLGNGNFSPKWYVNLDLDLGVTVCPPPKKKVPRSQDLGIIGTFGMQVFYPSTGLMKAMGSKFCLMPWVKKKHGISWMRCFFLGGDGVCIYSVQPPSPPQKKKAWCFRIFGNFSPQKHSKNSGPWSWTIGSLSEFFADGNFRRFWTWKPIIFLRFQ